MARCLMTRDVTRCLVTRDVARCLVTRDAILRFRLDVCIRLQETVATLALEQASCRSQPQCLVRVARCPPMEAAELTVEDREW